MQNTARKPSLDEILEKFTFETSNYLYKHKKQIILIAALLVLGVAAIGGYFYWMGVQEEKKLTSFYNIEKIYNLPKDELNDQEKLNQINYLGDEFSRNFPDSYQRNIIEFYKGKLKVELGQKKAAVSHFDEVIYQVKQDAPIKTLAAIELAHIYQEQKQAAKAIQVLQTLETDLFAELKMFELAEAYSANKNKQQALNYYKIFLKDYPNSPYKNYVQKKAASLK